jgi:hypothetical protein
MSISPGDQMEASVTVIKTHVTLRVRDLTSGAYISKSLRMAKPDTSSADWIVEAPSNCDGDNHCVPLPLSNFGNVSFTNSTAATATHTGPISDPTWSATQLELSGSAVRSGRGRYFGAIPEDSAVPTALSGLGNAFSVGWQQDTIAATSTGGTTVPSSGLYPGFGQGNGGAP